MDGDTDLRNAPCSEVSGAKTHTEHNESGPADIRASVAFCRSGPLAGDVAASALDAEVLVDPGLGDVVEVETAIR